MENAASQFTVYKPPTRKQPASGGNDGALLLGRRDPMACARAFVEHYYTPDGTCLLRHHRGAFHGWTGAAWPEKDRGELRAKIWAFFELALSADGAPFRPTSGICNDILDALASIVHLDTMVEPPAWLDGRDGPPPGEFLVCRNGVLHLPTRCLHPHDPALFTPTALPFDFDPDAGDPKRWLDFLDKLWTDDPESIDVLQDVFGYRVDAVRAWLAAQEHTAERRPGPPRRSGGKH